MATFYDAWLDNKPYTQNMGSFHTALMEVYKLASESNRAKLRIAFPQYFDETYKEATFPPSIDYIMKKLEITASYDTAKPQQWMDSMVDTGAFDRKDLYLNYVWLYDDKARIFGRPFNYKAAYADYLNTIINQ